MRIYAIIESIPYGEYVHIISARTRREAKKLAPISQRGEIESITLIKIGKTSKVILSGGSEE